MKPRQWPDLRACGSYRVEGHDKGLSSNQYVFLNALQPLHAYTRCSSMSCVMFDGARLITVTSDRALEPAPTTKQRLSILIHKGLDQIEIQERVLEADC